MLAAFASGFLLGQSLILAIGAQNAFVLRQGLKREHVFFVCLVCALSDAVLISAGVAGFGHLAERAPWLADLMLWGGAAFVFGYGINSLRRAWRGGEALKAGGPPALTVGAAILTALAFTWLNPHVYLDTVVLIGSVAAQSGERLYFGLGAVTASFVFFFGLGYCARLLAPVFARPRAWQVLDFGIGVIMCGLAVRLLVM